MKSKPDREVRLATLAAPYIIKSAKLWRQLHRLMPLGQRYNWWIRKIVGSHTLLQVPWGEFSLLMSGDWLNVSSSASAPIYRTPREQNPEFFAILADVLKRTRPGTVVDVGANIGTYTLNIRGQCPAPIIAFEPDPFLFGLLQRNIASNRLPDVSARNCACGDDTGVLAFRTGINGSVLANEEQIRGTVQEGVISVPVVRLDDELAEESAVRLIKIDCEGFEFKILRGGWNAIRQHRPVLFVELHPKLIQRFDDTLGAVCDLLEPLYDLQFWDIESEARSSGRWARFFARYNYDLSKIPNKAGMLAIAEADPKPEQLFLLGLPKTV